MRYDKKLYKVLAFAGWSQDRLADLLGVSTPTVNSWANGRSEPSGKHLAMIDELYEKLVEPYVCELETKADALAAAMMRSRIAELPEDNVCPR